MRTAPIQYKHVYSHLLDYTDNPAQQDVLMDKEEKMLIKYGEERTRRYINGNKQVDEIADFQEMLLDVALEAAAPDCAVAFERANKAFLLSANGELLDKAEIIRDRLAQARDNPHVTDLSRLHDEVAAFIKQGRKKLAAPAP